jgi:hypothetical protein
MIPHHHTPTAHNRLSSATQPVTPSPILYPSIVHGLSPEAHPPFQFSIVHSLSCISCCVVLIYVYR